MWVLFAGNGKNAFKKPAWVLKNSILSLLVWGPVSLDRSELKVLHDIVTSSVQ